MKISHSNDEFIPSVWGKSRNGSHCSCKVELGVMEVFDMAVLSRSIGGSLPMSYSSRRTELNKFD